MEHPWKNLTRPTIRRRAVPPAAVLWLAGTILLCGCEINKPEMPTFDTAYTVPLGVERIEIMEAIEDEDFLFQGQDGTLGFTVEGDPDTMAFDFDLTADIEAQSINEGLGNFELPAPAPLAYAFELGDLWPPAAGVVGLTVPVPAFPIDVTSAGQDIPDVDSANLASGSAVITVTNGFPVPVSAEAGPDQLFLTLENPTDGAVLATFLFGSIAPGETASRTADLAGVDLPGEVRVRLTGGSPGSGGSPVTVNGTDSIAVDAEFRDLVVSQAQAVIGAQSFQTSFDTDLPADYEVTAAVIESGMVSVAMTNEMSIACQAVLQWPTLVDLDGAPLAAVYDLAAGASVRDAVDFGGRILVSGGVPVTTLTATVDITTDGSDGLSVPLSAADGLTADLSDGTITFASVTGIVPDHVVDVEPLEEEIDLPNELDGLRLTAATLAVRLTNTADLPGDVALTLTGVSAAGTSLDLTIDRRIEPATTRAPQVTSIILDQTNSTILDFLNNLPERITLAGTVAVGGATGTVRADDYAVVDWEITAPMEVIVDEATIESDPAELDIDSDMQEVIIDHALGARVQTEILNHLPVGVELRILAGTDPETITASPLLSVGPIVVAPALVDPGTHVVSEPVVSTPEIRLTAAEAKLFGTPGLYTLITAVLPSTEGQPVRMMSTDYLEIRGVVRLDVEVNDQW